MLRQLSSSHGNGRSMVIHPFVMKNDPSVVWPHDNGQSIMIPPQVKVMLCQLPSSHDNVQSMVVHPKGMKSALSVVIVLGQRSEHCYSFLRYETCSLNCLRLMTMVRA